MVMGVLFLFAGKMEKVIFDKEKNRIVVEVVNIFCKRKVKTYRLSAVK